MAKSSQPKTGLRGKDRQQEHLRDRRKGAYDPVRKWNEAEAQPEGLKRERVGPYGKTRGRR
jgi:hypothetical protein